jgi:hypothetical protein
MVILIIAAHFVDFGVRPTIIEIKSTMMSNMNEINAGGGTAG